MKEIHTREDLALHLASGQCLTDVAIQGLNLQGFESQLAAVEVDGAILLGCEVEPHLLCDLSHRGCFVFPAFHQRASNAGGSREARADQRASNAGGSHEARADQRASNAGGSHEARADQRASDAGGSRADQRASNAGGSREARADQRASDAGGSHEARADQRASDAGGSHEARADQRASDAGGSHEPGPTALPFEPFRPHLYSPDELFAGFNPSDPLTYCRCLDGRVYEHYVQTGRSQPDCIRETLARRLHDHSITDALHDFLEESGQARHGVIAIMGGHSMRRDSPQYQWVAEASRLFARQGYLLVSGGGPGAMEATHLGAWFVDRSIEEMAQAIQRLADFGDETSPAVPDYQQRQWLANAFEVMSAYPPPTNRHTSLGIPTWLYGHEPPTPLATHIAKYFANSVREEGLITIATAGIVFAPGSFGTFQEVFQDAAQNHYTTAPAKVSPMVFLGRAYWENEKPLFPLLEKLAAGSQLKPYLCLADSVEEVVRFINEHPPVASSSGGWSFCDDFGSA